MRDKSNLTIFEFLLLAIFWGGVSMLWYRGLLFRLIEPFSFKQCKTLLWGMVLGSILISTFCTCRYHKNTWAVTSSLSIPFGIYTILAYKGFIYKKVNMFLLILTIFILIYVLLVICRKINKRKNIGKVLKVRCYKCLHGAQGIAGLGLLLFVLSLGIPVFLGEPVFRTSVTAEEPVEGQGETIANNIDTVLLLQEESWLELDIKEKLDVLQTIANIEANYLGIPHELNVCAEDLEEPKLGMYADDLHMIYLDLDHVQYDSAHSVLNSLTHEAFHGYSKRMIDAYESTSEELKELLIYEKAVRYKEEFSNYKNGKDNVSAYYTQACEKDAREYAESAVKDYYYRIAQYLDKQIEN